MTKKILGFAATFAFVASFAFASLTLPFFAGEASAQIGDAPIIAADVGNYNCGDHDDGFGNQMTCDGLEVIIDCIGETATLCDTVIPDVVTIGTTVNIDIIIDSVTGAFISLAPDPNVVEVGPVTEFLHPDVIILPSDDRPGYNPGYGPGEGFYPTALAKTNALEKAALVWQAEVDAEELAAAEAFSLKQAEEEKACRGVPLALKRLLCAAKI